MSAVQPRGLARVSRHGLSTLFLGCTALVAVPQALHAQEADATEFRLSPIIISGSSRTSDDDANTLVAQELWVGGKVATSILDTPASVSVITQKEIEQRDAQTVEEVLQYSPGIVTDYYGSDDRNDYYLVRGYQATTYRDGLTLGTMRGVREEPFAYERVEVLRGANSTLFGPADPGGSVNFVTKVPRFERLSEGYVSLGSNEHYEAGFDFGNVANEAGTVAYRFTGKLQNSNLEYDYSKDNAAFLMGGVTWAPDDVTSLTLVIDYLNRDGTPNSGGYPLDRLYDRSEFFGEPGLNFHDVDRTSVTAMFSHEFDNGLSLKANLRYSDLSDDFAYIYLYDYAGRVGTVLPRYYFGTDSSADEVIGNAILQYDARMGRIDSSTLAGVEFRNASTSATSIYGAAAPIDIANPVFGNVPTVFDIYQQQDQDYNAQAIFLQQNFALDDRYILTLGARHDWLDISSVGQTFGTAFDDQGNFSETSYRAALTWKITPEVSAYASYVESVQPPVIGAEPERGQQTEIGVKYAPAGMNAIFSAALYDLRQDNISVAVVQSNGTILRETVGETRVRGLDLEARAELTEAVSLIGAYSYMDSEVLRSDPLYDGTSVEGNRFASVPEHLASLWVNYALPGAGDRGDTTFSLGARYVGSYYFNLANTGAKSEPTTLVDAAISYQIRETTDLALNVRNIFDNQHVVGSGTANYYNPGREFAVTLRHRF